MRNVVCQSGKRPPLHVAPSAGEWKVGLDLGTLKCAYQEVSRAASGARQTRGLLFPSAVGYARPPGAAGEETEILIGENAISSDRVHHLVFPQREEGATRSRALLDFATRLRHYMSARSKERPWGVVARSCQASDAQTRELRAVANTLFERVLLVDESRLLALAVYHEIEPESAILVDIGASGTRFHVLEGRAPAEGGSLAEDHGGNAIDAILRQGLTERYPDLRLSETTLRAMKERLAFVGDGDGRPRTLHLTLGPSLRPLDVTELVRDACESIIPVVVGGIRKMLRQCESNRADTFLQNIFLLGGGSRIRGLGERIEEVLADDGVESARVRALPAPQSLVAIGALKWSISTDDSRWGIPLFSYGA